MKIQNFFCKFNPLIILGGVIFVGWISCAYSAQDNLGGMRHHFILGIVGYNYTDREIEEYSVDGVSGGSVSMSSPTSGGSGTTCCARLPKDANGIIRVKLRWQFDGCRYLIKDYSGGADEVRHFFYRETEVNVVIPSEKNLAYIESHFYPNGRVEVRLTKNVSPPTLALNKKRPDNSSFPWCKDGKKPGQ